MLAMEIMFAGLGILFLYLGWTNWKGDISSIHSYNRHRVAPCDIPRYGKWMGGATMLMGAGFLLTALLVFFLGDQFEWAALPAVIVGIAMMLYAQFRFNKGIF